MVMWLGHPSLEYPPLRNSPYAHHPNFSRPPRVLVRPQVRNRSRVRTMSQVYVRCSNAVHQAWHEFVDTLFDPYRPELYYMRGPGPKWRAKNNGAIAQQ